MGYRKTLGFLVFVLLGAACSEDLPRVDQTPWYDVVILDDDSPGIAYRVAQTLEDAGFTVSRGSSYNDLFDSIPTIDIDDIVILMEDEAPFDPDTDAALAAHVNAGGHVIRFEWSAFYICNLSNPGTFRSTMIPVLARPCAEADYPSYYYANPATAHLDHTDEETYVDAIPWITEMTGHALIAGIPTTGFSTEDLSGCTSVDAMDGATVVIASEQCGPMLTYQTFGTHGGTVVHINDDLKTDHDGAYHDITLLEQPDNAPLIYPTPDPNVLKILVNAVGFLMMR